MKVFAEESVDRVKIKGKGFNLVALIMPKKNPPKKGWDIPKKKYSNTKKEGAPLFWILLAGFISSFWGSDPIRGFLIQLLAFCFVSKAFYDLPGAHKSSLRIGDMITLAFLSVSVMLVYNLILLFFIHAPFFVSLDRFIVLILIMLSYILLGILLVLFAIGSLVLVSYFNYSLLNAFKFLFKFLFKNSKGLLLSFFFMGFLLFIPYYCWKVIYQSFAFNPLGSLLYYSLVPSVFAACFYGTKLTLKQAQIDHDESKKGVDIAIKKQPLLYRFLYLLSLILLVDSPLFSLFLVFNGLAYSQLNQSAYRLMLWSWFIWLIASTYFLLISKSQSIHIYIIVLIPLIVTIFCFFNLKAPPFY